MSSIPQRRDEASLRAEFSPGARAADAASPAARSALRDTSSLRLGRAFTLGRPSLVAYVVAGYPTREESLEALEAVATAGADLIEVGVPYTDQLADGPVIVNAATVAREAAGGEFGLVEALEVVRQFRERMGDAAPPLALMCYLNPIMRFGFEAAAEAMVDAGIEGVIVPDMPADYASDWLAAAEGRLDTVFLAAPTSTPERLETVGQSSSGFVYCVSTTGITGERTELPASLSETVQRVRRHTNLPVAVGFGVSTPEQAASVARIADGVVVGSAFVRRQQDPEALANLVREIASAVHSAC